MVYDVIVIGSGAAGLHCAHKLSKEGYKVVVVEADQRIGGRTRQDVDFTQWPIELGGEMIHGGDTLYYQLAKENNWGLIEVFSMELFSQNSKNTFFYLGRERKLIAQDQVDDDMALLFKSLGSMKEDTKNMTLEQVGKLNLLELLVQKGVPYRVLGLADAVYSKTWGTNLDRIGVREAIREDEKPQAILKNYKIQQSSKALVDHLANGLEIKTNWRAKSVDYRDKSGVSVASYQGKTIHAKAAVVTVPLTILKENDINFIPALPQRKLDAIDVIGMDAGMKIIGKFNKKFWRQDCQLVLCGDSPVPQIWMDGPPLRPLAKQQTPEFVVTGFITGDQAKSIAALSPAAQIKAFLNQLDSMFGNSQDWTPATNCFISHIVYDWCKNPFVRGAYSYPSLIPSTFKYKESPNQILSEFVDKKLFFAGEATATQYELSTINGALQTGLRAYHEIKENLPLTSIRDSKL